MKVTRATKSKKSYVTKLTFFTGNRKAARVEDDNVNNWCPVLQLDFFGQNCGYLVILALIFGRNVEQEDKYLEEKCY